MLINDHVEQCCLTNSAPQAAACLSIQHQAPSSSMPSPQPMRSLTFEEPKDAVACSAVVACPICGVEVGEADINRHLDETHAAADDGGSGGWGSSRGASSQSEVDGAVGSSSSCGSSSSNGGSGSSGGSGSGGGGSGSSGGSGSGGGGSGSRSRGDDGGGGVGDGGGGVGDSGGGVGGGFGGSGGGGSRSCGASVPSEAGRSGVEASSLVRCPICAVEMSLAELNAHLDAGDCCVGGATEAACPAAAESAAAESIVEEPATAGSAAESAVGESAAAAAATAAATAVAAAAEAAAEVAVAAAAEAAAAAAGRGTARRLRLEQLGKEMRCPICFDLFDRPHSLPCQHSFCYECVMGCFRATSKMECPLCKAPTWRRQVTTNHTLAGIVQAFEALQEQAADSPVRGAARATVASPAASRASPASTASPTF